MKYRHYAPKTKCKLIYANDDNKQIDLINRIIKENNNVIILSFEDHRDKFLIDKDKIISIGSKIDKESIAKSMYSALREADTKNAEVILIEGVEKKGLGIAIMNRLLRTCEYDYIEGWFIYEKRN